MEEDLPDELVENMKKSGSDLPEEFRERIGQPNSGFRDGYGESQEVLEMRERPLHPECKKKAIEWWVDPRDLDLDMIDVESVVTERERLGEDLEKLKRQYQVSDEHDRIQNIENEIEKYRYLWEKYKESHGGGH